MSPIAERVIDRLDATRQRWWLFTLLTTTVLAAAVSVGILLVFVLFDALLVFPRVVLAGLFLVWLTVTLAIAAFVLRRIFRNQRSLQATARRVESEYPELGSNLINLVQLADDSTGADPAFCEAAVRQSVAQIGQIQFEDAAYRQTRRRRFLFRTQTPRDLAESSSLLGLLIAVAILLQMILPNWGSAANRLLSPWKFVPSIGEVGQIEVTPGDADVLVGGSLEITGSIANPHSKPYKAVLWLTSEGGEGDAEDVAAGETTDLPMTPDEDNRNYKLTIPAIIRPHSYRLEIGDSQSRQFRVGVRSKPTVREVEVTYHYPKYLDHPADTTVQKQADLQAPQYTVAELKIRPSVPIATGYVLQSGRRVAAKVEENGNLLLVKHLAMIENGTFTIHLENDAGHSDPDPRVNRIRIVPDRPPSVQLLKPGRQSSAAQGSEVAVIVRGVDDHGLGAVKLQTKIKPPKAEGSAESDEPPQQQETSEQIVTVKSWNGLDGPKTSVLKHALKLDGEDLVPGSVLLVRAVVYDRRVIDNSQWGLNLKPQMAEGPWHAIRLIDRQKQTDAALEKLQSLRASIFNILEKQIRSRVKTAKIPKEDQPPLAARLADDVRSRQVAIQKTTKELVESIGKTEQEERRAIKRVLNNLAVSQMLDVVQKCDALRKIRALDQYPQPVAGIIAVQDEVITVLRKLLDATRKAEARLLSEMKKRPGGDLPDDVEKKLEEMRDKLAEFMKQQKKVIEATENLAKTPVEDFTEEEEELLKKLAASEDDWAQFMKDLHSDMSKLAEQDFANPSMLKELVEIQTEIKMAKDALTKKTADIAVPLEQLGYEMAEDIKTNMEKWLPDTPDRELWSQEESLSDEDKEAPMAELPGELEDLIGELMEEEEDLFDEMEDVSSSAADSLDKGAGWDALDGPISNMSAKGVTGNRLPNTSEMSGRAGEGRSGKSSGEFVGDEAVGKGGRKTPSRLTADPYEKGQIKDHSKDPVGGATGGGKESGQGGEGLEGPQNRNPGKRDMQRLAGKQASLRNKAESIDLQFKIANFHHTDMGKMIETMSQIERDLKAGRYKNALRQRKSLVRGLDNVKQYVQGEFHVRQDATSNLPTDIQKEILGTADDPSPTGWEEMNRDYFRRLSNQGQ